MNTQRIWFVTALLVVLVVAQGWAAEKPLKIEILLSGKDIPLGLEGATDWTLTNTVKKLVVERTGVDAEWSRLGDATIGSMLQMRMLAGNVPHVLDAWWFHMDAEGALAIRENDLAWEITPSMVRTYLPKYTARLAKYGVTVERLLATSRYLGRNIFLPTGLPYSVFPALAGHAGTKEPAADYYAVGLRDDVLKRIFPSARTEAELQELLVRKGSLDINDIVGDIPIRNLDDLYRYLKAVKALNLKVGAKPLIPGAITASSQYMKSVDWSLRTIIGYFWDWSIIRGDPPDWERSTLIEFTPEYKEYWRWWNRAVQRGPAGPRDVRHEGRPVPGQAGERRVRNHQPVGTDRGRAPDWEGAGLRVPVLPGVLRAGKRYLGQLRDGHQRAGPAAHLYEADQGVRASTGAGVGGLVPERGAGPPGVLGPAGVVHGHRRQPALQASVRPARGLGRLRHRLEPRRELLGPRSHCRVPCRRPGRAPAHQPGLVLRPRADLPRGTVLRVPEGPPQGARRDRPVDVLRAGPARGPVRRVPDHLHRHGHASTRC